MGSVVNGCCREGRQSYPGRLRVSGVGNRKEGALLRRQGTEVGEFGGERGFQFCS